jgi:beta-galactosidase
MNRNFKTLTILFLSAFIIFTAKATPVRITENIGSDWKFYLGDVPGAKKAEFDDSQWRTLNLPHDWSIEGEFSEKNPASPEGGALPGGIGWYRKTFALTDAEKNKNIIIQFDGIYRNSEVYINGQFVGNRPYGFTSFYYDITQYVKFGNQANIISVRVDNSKQPNSRWYSGSGIYRNVWLIKTDKTFIEPWGTCITTANVSAKSATISINTSILNNETGNKPVTLNTSIYNVSGIEVGKATYTGTLQAGKLGVFTQEINIISPILWSIDKPYLYKAVCRVVKAGKVADEYTTAFGIRTVKFDSKGFWLNGKSTKIKGVCLHHDLGCLGSAFNTRAMERQLEIMKAMGCNAIRTSHNPPAPEMLDLCDKMGFVVMDEAFDMWAKGKTKFDYSNDWDSWNKRDLRDMIIRDRNHPSIIMWSIGNEISEQSDTTGTVIANELADVVKMFDKTRPITSACNQVKINNFILKSGALDILGFNYHHALYPDLPTMFPGKKYILSETTSSLHTRGEYNMPSGVIRRWSGDEKRDNSPRNADYTCSAYDNCSAPWGSTHEETLLPMKKYDYLTGIFVWTGFDYLGEPTPYSWPARSSYFGIVDLAGFPKDVYYLYQSEWTSKPVLHILPHWNWKQGDTIDVWAYSNAPEVELFLNGKSLGTAKKAADKLHFEWKTIFEPGTLKAVSKANGKEILTSEIKTAGTPAKIVITADRKAIKANGVDLSFVTVKIADKDGNMVPKADNLVQFDISGEGAIVGVDNGNPVSHESFKAKKRKAFNGLCLAVIQSTGKPGTITVKAASEGLEPAEIVVNTK